MARASSSSKTSSPSFSSTLALSRGTMMVPLDLRLDIFGRRSFGGMLSSCTLELEEEEEEEWEGGREGSGSLMLGIGADMLLLRFSCAGSICIEVVRFLGWKTQVREG